MRILFQGDSITDCGRSKEKSPDQLPESLGRGYVSLLAERLEGTEVLNRGISGNRIVDLYARWKPDALQLKPDLLSILVGVNDTWHEFTSGNGVEVPRYAAIYRMLLAWTVENLPGVRLVLCEPFVLPVDDARRQWRAEIDERCRVVAELCQEFDATLVPFQAEFDAALLREDAGYWAEDGVHPTMAGHHLLADCWMRHAFASAQPGLGI